MINTITIKKRFCGPSESGNGGYVCGMVAKYINGAAEVTLLKPPPLDKPLIVEKNGDGEIILKNRDILIAKGRPCHFELDVPAPPSYEKAKTASKKYVGFSHHLCPKCFVCGTERDKKDGLGIFAGPLDNGMVAAPWNPYESLAGTNGKIKPEFIWAALDCPGYFAYMEKITTPMLLGRLCAAIYEEIIPQKYIVTGWKISSQGRKHYAGTAIFSQSGRRLCAKAKATWIKVDSF